MLRARIRLWVTKDMAAYVRLWDTKRKENEIHRKPAELGSGRKRITECFFFKSILLSRLASVWTGRLVTYYTST